MKKGILLIASFFLVFLTSCNDDELSTKSTFSIQQKQLLQKSTNNKIAVTNAMNGTFTFTNVVIGVSEIEFESEYESGEVEIEKEIEYEGSFQFDVLNGTSSPSLPPVDLEAGVYQELEINIDNVLDSGNSVEIAGTYNDGISEYMFEFSSKMDEEFEIENEMGIELNVNETVHFVLYLQLESLFNGVDFSSAIADNDGIIRINSTSNSEIASLLEDSLEDIMEFEDEDDDHDND